MISTERYNIFLYVAQSRSFSIAAKQLHLSQPTVSKHISSLERELNVQLFIRKASGVQLTEAGKTLLPLARKLVKDSIEIQKMMSALDEEIHGDLTIACSTTAGKYILPKLAARFKEKNPGLRISIPPCTQENVCTNLLNAEVDLGVASIEMQQNGLECQYFFTDHITMIVPSDHHFAERSAINADELINERFILREPTSGTWRVLQSELTKHDIAVEDLNVFLVLGNSEAIVASVSDGLGISFVSKMASKCARDVSCVVEVLVEDFNLERKICISRKKIAPSNRALEAFWSFINDPENEDLFLLTEL